MAENDDTFDKPLENPPKQETEKTPDENIPVVESEKIIPEQETKTMETHAYHLHRAPGKKIWHYFFEFLMLFLAVFCGFLAENWREQLREHKREKEFIHSIVEDIKSDTLQSNKTLLQLKRIKSGMDSVLILLSSPGIVDNSNEACRLWTKYMGLEVFVSNDRTIQQLKNNGELRLIRNRDVSDRIMNYDQTLKKYYAQSNLMYSAVLDVNDYSQLFDFISLGKNKNIPVPLPEQGKRSLTQAYAHLQLWNRGLIGLISWLEDVNQEGTRLVTFIQKEYHVE
jgi:uridine kinase